MSGTVYIPVWFHVIYASSGAGNISQERIDAQMAVLNEDFAGTATASATNVSIQFTLAGVTRTENDTWFTSTNQYLYKPPLAVDTTRYLNIYTKSYSLLGSAYLPPGTAGTILDGVIMRHNTIGGRDNGYSVYDQGRTLVHEVGHYRAEAHLPRYWAHASIAIPGDLITDAPQRTADYGCSAGTSCGNASR